MPSAFDHFGGFEFGEEVIGRWRIVGGGFGEIGGGGRSVADLTVGGGGRGRLQLLGIV